MSSTNLEAGVPIAELKFLLNHAVSSGGVTMGYLHPSLDHLRAWQEKATARILSAIDVTCIRFTQTQQPLEVRA